MNNYCVDLGLLSVLCKHITCLGDFFSYFSLLASGSDDQHAIVWDPFRHKKLTTMHTGHAANIFSVKVSRSDWKREAVNGRWLKWSVIM